MATRQKTTKSKPPIPVVLCMCSLLLVVNVIILIITLNHTNYDNVCITYAHEGKYSDGTGPKTTKCASDYMGMSFDAAKEKAEYDFAYAGRVYPPWIGVGLPGQRSVKFLTNKDMVIGVCFEDSSGWNIISNDSGCSFDYGVVFPSRDTYCDACRE